METNNLDKISSSGFKTPDNYFESFDDKLFKKLSENTPLADVKDTGFNVPDDYFNSIEDKVFSHIEKEETPVIKLNSRKNLYYIAGIAASLMLLFAIYFREGNVNKNEISVEMVETYLEESDLDTYELAELLSDADVLEDDFTIVTTPYSEDNLESYILDNVDIESYLE